MKNKEVRSLENNEIIRAIELAKIEWQNAEYFFQVAREPELVDYAIYLQNAARARYAHLLKLAKIKNISVNYYESMKELAMK